MINLNATGIRNVRNVLNYTIGNGSISHLSNILPKRSANHPVIFFIDEFFKEDKDFINRLDIHSEDAVFFIPTKNEPTTEYIDLLADDLRSLKKTPIAIVGAGGGTTLDTTKAISNLLTNEGNAADYQGWDLVKKPGIYKIAVPTISGTGAEATRTCVMTNIKTGLKLGMNSDFTVFDYAIMDPELTKTVPRDQYFYTGMDAYIHCFEALSGSYRNMIGDSFSRETMSLCRQIFVGDEDMMSDQNRERLMVASYLGGCSIATSYVGLVHPLSAALSVVLGTHHCISNCIVMRAMRDFYPKYFDQFWEMVDMQKIIIPEGICRELGQEQVQKLYESTLMHEKPLTNALGADFKKILSRDVVHKLFMAM